MIAAGEPEDIPLSPSRPPTLPILTNLLMDAVSRRSVEDVMHTRA